MLGSNRYRAFTLVEILVVIGVLVLLAAVVVPMVGRAWRQAKATRTAADLSSITTAIQAYKLDHGDIPRVEMVVSHPPAPPFQSTADRPNPRTGAQVLAQAMLGHLDAGEPAGYPTTTDAFGNVVPLVHVKQDGANGYGFTLRPAREVSPGKFEANSKTYGPYVAPEKYRVLGDALLKTFVDSDDRPILYFPRKPGPLNTMDYVGRTTDHLEPFEFDLTDNFEDFRNVGESDADLVTRMHTLFGDTDADENIEPPDEKPAFEGEYVLWAAGADGVFGTDDDVKVQP